LDAQLLVERVKVALTATEARIAGSAALVFRAVAAPDASGATLAAAAVNAPQVVARHYCPVSQP
jgi:hypothetical protein